ncbi:MAG: CBS domain-containing protein [Nanoarchaeota archaeon]|nr:CBS domain-containing protein [Nanoarchaeota archaeon]
MVTMTKQKSIVFIIIFLMNSLFVLANHPSLPTSVYGQILNSNSVPAQDLTVTAKYIDNTGIERTLTTKTLTYGNSPDGELVGFYFFNMGYLKAAESSTITIEIENVKREIESNPGAPAARLDFTLISQQQGNTQTNKGVPSGTAYSPTPGEPTDPTPWDGTGQPTPGGSSESTSSQGGSTGAIPTLPTTIYGQLLDEYGEPVEGEEVTAEWTDEICINHHTTTTTLTKKEASKLGDKSLKGHYMFNKGEIRAKPDSSVKIKSEKFDTYNTIQSKPGEKVKSDIMHSFSSPSSSKKAKTESPIINSPITIINTTISGLITDKKFKINFSLIIFLIASSILYLTIIHREKITKKVKGLIEGATVNRLNKDVTKLVNMKAKNFMTKSITTIEEDKDVISAIDSFISQGIGCIIVTQGDIPVGILTERDLLRKIDFKKRNLKDIKIKEVMSSPVKTVDPNISLLEAAEFSLNKNIRKMLVTKNSKLIGLVTQTDIAKEFDKFISKNEFDPSNIPIIKTIVTDNILLAEEPENLLEVTDYMLKEHADAVLVTIKSKDTGQEEIEGILTERDIIEEFYKNPDYVGKLKVENTLNRAVFSITPGTNVFKANKEMIDKGIRRIPVMSNKTLGGIVTQTDIVKSITYFLTHLSSKDKKKLGTIMQSSK